MSNTKRQRINRHLKHQIITSCGDANVMMGSKHIDPALCIYIGAYLICIDNKHLRDKVPWGNGTLCQVLGVQLKENAQSYKWKNYYGKKVWTVNAADVEWVECEHVNKTNLLSQLKSQINELQQQMDLTPNDHQSKKQTIKSKLDDLNNKLAKEIIGRRFKLEPEQFSPEVSVKHYHASSKKVTFQCKMMKQIPANSNDATTGHKLQGMSKDARCYHCFIMANRKLGSNVQKLGVCRLILCPNTIRTVPCKTNRYGQIIPAISPTSIIHGLNKKIRERHAGETPASNIKNIL